MSDAQHPMDWSKTTFDGSRREQLRQAQRMTVRQRLEALDELTELSERLRVMPRQATSGAGGTDGGTEGGEKAALTRTAKATMRGSS